VPYIRPDHRAYLDPLIEKLAARIWELSSENSSEEEVAATFSGLLNYACTKLALSVLYDLYGRMRYWLIALSTGVFKNIADEFYRRVAAPYEDKQIAKNGDVDLYQEYANQIAKL